MTQILGLLGMYFDAAIVFVTSHSLLFRLALAILCFKLHFTENKSAEVSMLRRRRATIFFSKNYPAIYLVIALFFSSTLIDF